MVSDVSFLNYFAETIPRDPTFPPAVPVELQSQSGSDIRA